ncbi:MAG: hypothetical protein RLZZ216_774 [Cyanobacteriota bacterium]
MILRSDIIFGLLRYQVIGILLDSLMIESHVITGLRAAKKSRLPQ